MSLYVTTNDQLKTYLSNILQQINAWLEQKLLKKLVLVVTSVETKEVLERWVFDIETDAAITATGSKEKSEKEISGEIAALTRQITSCVTFLPLLEDACTFDLLVYTDNNTNTPIQWEESDARLISKSEEVRLRSFTTSIHKVEATVAYKVGA